MIKIREQMKKVVIFGTGPFAEVIYFYLKNDSKYKIAAFTSNKKYIKTKKLFDLPIVPYEEIEKEYPPEKFDMFIAIGYSNNNKVREKFFLDSKKRGYNLISYINSKAIIWEKEKIGENCFILENNVIQPFVKIGNNVIIWSGNHIGHHSIIDQNCFISSHVVISGNVRIKKNCFLGVNSTIRDEIEISPYCIIGAGTIILKNTKANEVFAASNSPKHRNHSINFKKT